MVAPFGVFAATLLLTLYLEHWQWQGRDSWKLATDQVDLGAVIYAMAAVLVERGVRIMFWALDERRKWRAKMRAEARAEGLAEGLAEGRAEGKVQGLAEGQVQGLAEGQAQGRTDTQRQYDAWLAKVAEKRGIPLNELLPPDRDAE